MKRLAVFLAFSAALFGQSVSNPGVSVASPSTNGLAFWDGTKLVTTPTGGAGTLCVVTTNGGTPTVASCAGSISTSWSALSNPSANVTVSVGNNTTTFTAGTATTAPFLFEDTTGNTGTGPLVEVSTIGTSTALPLKVTAQGTANGVQMTTAGLLTYVGTGSINANQVSGAAVPTSAVILGTNASNQLIAATTTGSGATAVLATGPAIGSPVITGHETIEGQILSGVTGTANLVLSASPTFTGTVNVAALTLTGNLTTAITGSTQCLHANSAGVISGTGADCGSGGGGSSAWSALTNPAGNLALSQGANTTTFTWNAATGAANLFNLTDALNNTGTGYLFSVNLASGSAAKPAEFAANGNGVAVSNSGVLAALGLGHVNADEINGVSPSSLATGLLKNTTTTGVFSIAVSGTDYAPATSGNTGLLAPNGSGGFSAAALANVLAAGWTGGLNCTGSNRLGYDGNCYVAGGQAGQLTGLGNISTAQTLNASSNTNNTWSFTLTGSIAGAATLSGASAGQYMALIQCQNATGGFTWTPPTGFTLLTTLSPLASVCTRQFGVWDGSAFQPLAPAFADGGATILKESAMPAGNPASGTDYQVADSTQHQLQVKDSSGNLNSTVRTAASGTTHQWVDYLAATGIPHTSQPAFTDISGALALTSLATQAADTVLLNATAGSAAPTAVAMPTTGTNGCAGAANALQYNTTTHALGCGTITAGGAALSSLTAAAGANSINNGDNAQTWNWSLTTASKSAFTFGENVASTATGTPVLFNINTLAASTANPFQVTALGTANGIRVNTSGVLAAIGTGHVNADQLNNAAATGANGNVASWGAANALGDSNVAVANLVTATANYTGGNLVQAAANNKTTSDSGIAVAIVPTQASNAAAANQILQSGGANKTVVANDFPDVKDVPFCINVNGTVAVGVTTTTAVTCTLRAGTNNKTAFYGPFTTSDAIIFPVIHLPKDWNTGGSIGLSVDLASTDVTSGHTVILQASSECSKLDGSTTDDVAFNTAQSMSTVSLNTTANQTWTTTLSALTTTGCSAPGLLWIKITRTTDTATNVELYGASVTIPRRPVVQAN